MQQIVSAFPPGTVIVPTSGTPRYMEFYDCLDQLRVPAGTRKTITKSSDLARALNQATDQMKGEWVFYLGDDHTFSPDVLLRLLTWDLPAVVALNISRVAPFGPVVLRGQIDEMPEQIAWDEVPAGNGLWYLGPRLHVGSNGLLIRKPMLDQIEKPIFRVGQIKPDILNEDFYLFQTLRRLGVPIVVDLGARMGHLNTFAAVPVLHDGRWQVVLARDNKAAVMFGGAAAPAVVETADALEEAVVP